MDLNFCMRFDEILGFGSMAGSVKTTFGCEYGPGSNPDAGDFSSACVMREDLEIVAGHPERQSEESEAALIRSWGEYGAGKGSSIVSVRGNEMGREPFRSYAASRKRGASLSVEHPKALPKEKKL